MSALTESTKFSRVLNAASSGTSTLATSAVDMQSFDAVCFLVAIGAITSGSPLGNVVITAQRADVIASPEQFETIAGSTVTLAHDADNATVLIEVTHPGAQYVRLRIARGGLGAAIDSVVAMQTRAHSEPVEHDASITSVVSLLSPEAA